MARPRKMVLLLLVFFHEFEFDLLKLKENIFGDRFSRSLLLFFSLVMPFDRATLRNLMETRFTRF